MTRAMRKTRFATAVFATLACGASYGAATPADTVDAFLFFYFKHYKLDLPQRPLLAEIKPLLTPRLYMLFDAAVTAQECRTAKVGNSEPPLFEGDIFSSMTEGGTAATPAPAEVTGDKAVVTVHWTYDDPNDEWQASSWDDRIFLQQWNGDWRIEDFAHDGNWNFMSKSRVSVTLQSIALECR
jgi:hypothetical protein